MSDRIQYQFADDAYNVQRGVAVETPSSRPANPSSYETETTQQRKRGKFTRSKTGCLTCRTKKVKCDEEKPDCKRCRDTQRKCTWPEVVPTRKRPSRRDTRQSESPVEVRPSTAGSSGLSDMSTPPPRTHSPSKQVMAHGHPSHPSLSHPSLSTRHISSPSLSGGQRQHLSLSGTQVPYVLNGHQLPSPVSSVPGYAPQHHHSHHHSAQQSYPYRYSSQSHYVQQQYPAVQGLSRVTTHAHDYAPVKLEEPADSPVKYEDISDGWQASQLMHHVDPIQPFFPTMQERDLVGHSHASYQQYRYQ